MCRRIIFGTVCAISLAVMLWCGWNLMAYAEEEQQFIQGLNALYKAAGIFSDGIIVAGDVQTVDVAALRRLNRDCVGWVSIPGTDLSYPVMHTMENPQYYLRRDFTKEENQHGTPFLDARCGLASDNLIVYGHNMSDGSMFALLHRYRDRSFWEKNPVIRFETTEQTTEYRVCAVLRTSDVIRSDTWSIFSSLNMDKLAWDTMATNLAERSLVETGITPTYGQKLLTLSTCESADGERRLVVVAVELNSIKK